MNLNKLFFLVLVACSSANLRADVIYEIGFEQANYVVEQGAAVNLKIIFREITDGEVGQLAPGNLGGLFSAGFILDFSTLNAAGLNVTFDGYNEVALFDPDFTTKTEDAVTQTLLVAQTAVDLNEGIEVDATLAGAKTVYEIELGELQFQNAGPAIGAATLQLSAIDGVVANLLIDNATGTQPTPISFGSTTLSAVPEPGSFAALLLLGAVLGWRTRKG